ncbi:MAG: hypothetical protein FJZ01_18785 [Candidatus Sericytochromatia bacterium]|nr:hypothetical protein [Candidatus Tanganyikabacteria bacterium]
MYPELGGKPPGGDQEHARADGSTEWPERLLRVGQEIEIVPAGETDYRFSTTILHVTDSRHFLCEPPDPTSASPLREQARARVLVGFLRDGEPPDQWSGVVISCGTWGLGLMLDLDLERARQMVNREEIPGNG